MGKILQFPTKGLKLSPEEEMALAKSSELFPRISTIEMSAKTYDQLQNYKHMWEKEKDEADRFFHECQELKSMSLWDRIFNWRY